MYAVSDEPPIAAVQPCLPANSNARKADRIAVDLLRVGLKMLDTNREAACGYILRACSVLEAADVVPDPIARPARGGLAPWQVQRVKTYVEANLEGSLTIPELSAVARLGPSHFQRAFKTQFDVSPHAYVVQRRIEKAQELMLTTDKPLCEIALCTGFSDQAHLATRFRRLVGTSPSVWRRERTQPSEHEPVLGPSSGLWISTAALPSSQARRRR
ncbi:MAG: AraC family transcriptional regulator [Rhizomicrobium sp.]